MRQPKPQWQAVCLTCYTCVLGTYPKKHDAERAATSHMQAYAHPVTVQEAPRK